MSADLRSGRSIELSPGVILAFDNEFLEALRLAGLTIGQRRALPRPDDWYFSSPAGEGGPFPSPEAALVEGVACLSRACRGAAGLLARQIGG
jgi:hypothetical protein